MSHASFFKWTELIFLQSSIALIMCILEKLNYYDSFDFRYLFGIDPAAIINCLED